MKPPKLTTWGIDWRAAETADTHQAPNRRLTNGAPDSKIKPPAMTKGSGPPQPATAGSDWHTFAPPVVLVHSSAPPGTNCATSARIANTGASSAIDMTTRR